MKLKKIFIVFLIFIIFENVTFGVEENNKEISNTLKIEENSKEITNSLKTEENSENSNNNLVEEKVYEEVSKGFGISDFTKEAREYTKENFPDFDLDLFIKNSIKGNADLSFLKNIIIKTFGKEVVAGIRLMTSVLVLIIIGSICRSIIENLSNEETAKIVYYVQYIIIATVVINSFLEILNLTRNTIEETINFMNLLVPLFTTLVLTTGNIVTTNMFQPILLFGINFTGNLLNDFLIPMLLIAISLSITSSILEKGQLDGISKFFKSSIVWILGIMLTIFTALLSLEGTLSSSVDGLTSKTAKATISNFIPVVRKNFRR